MNCWLRRPFLSWTLEGSRWFFGAAGGGAGLHSDSRGGSAGQAPPQPTLSFFCFLFVRAASDLIGDWVALELKPTRPISWWFGLDPQCRDTNTVYSRHPFRTTIGSHGFSGWTQVFLRFLGHFLAAEGPK